MPPPDEIQIQLDELDSRLDRLRALYEQYYVGIEKTEPFVQKKDVERRFQALRKVQLRNTATRFRFQTLVQKYTTYLTYWQRISRQVEEGTHLRNRTRVRPADARPRRTSEPSVTEIDAEEIELIEEAEDAPVVPPAPALPVFTAPTRPSSVAARPPPTIPTRGAGLSVFGRLSVRPPPAGSPPVARKLAPRDPSVDAHTPTDADPPGERKP